MKATIARDEMRNMLNDYRAALESAHQFTDPNFSAQAITDRRVALRQNATSMHTVRAHKLTEAAAASATSTARTADFYVSQMTVNDDRVTDYWAHSIRPRLDAGDQWHDILPGLNIEGLAAVERFGPSWERGQNRTRGPVEKLQTEDDITALIDGLRPYRWACLEGYAAGIAVAEAKEATAIAEVARAFEQSSRNVHKTADLSAASTYLNTVESPAFGGVFAASLAV